MWVLQSDRGRCIFLLQTPLCSLDCVSYSSVTFSGRYESEIGQGTNLTVLLEMQLIEDSDCI